MQKLRWGILGTGEIAQQFAEALHHCGCPITAVASRQKKKAAAFAAQLSIPFFTDDYAALCGKDDVDIVYVALPHTLHAELALTAISCGKHVLVEKPFALNAVQAEEVFAAAAQQHCFVMEAAWCRFLPFLQQMLSYAKSGVIGAIRCFKADFSIADGILHPEGRLMNPAVGGGALLDVGFYPLTVALMLFDALPERVQSSVTLQGGVDLQESMLLTFPGGEQALLYAGIAGALPEDAYIMGEKGYLHIPNFFYCTEATLHTKEGEEHFSLSFPCNGYEYEIEHVVECIAAGQKTSPTMPPHKTLSLLKIMDALRQEWGLSYPDEPGEVRSR